ncbi:sulfurtransferase complex subunit TusC [Gilvimarinus agarilyticus]|uniref:sulfurtransferase complex subunit TusC n=1 Tax=Gilvimarinus sp. 2_MG-2023 TaxID=3062666 RepID=UPI001C088EFA|nr:sulfurtransferase complex subunit TusC [Gilvimarinus sp. 2_MG-2023]MBU2887035.1 sulfurtransferase complex subunit TusC [Gilvimarinus agarilyticus]MDO6571695.1 sulfurtransferase complex subunit TusC [Gilvimarinus sp. 2_MG-2023]
MSRILCISRHSPYQTSSACDALDAVLAAGAFDQEVSLLLMNEGVWQAIKNQQASLLGRTGIGKKMAALPLFGVKQVYIHTPSLTQRGLTRDSLHLDAVQLVTNNEVRTLIQQHDQLLSF